MPCNPPDNFEIVPLHQVAHARSGDKGERLNIGLFAYREQDYQHLVDQVTEEKVFELFSHRGAYKVSRYLLPNLQGMNFVIDGALEGGVNGSLNLDGHGKTQSFRLLSLDIHMPK